MFPVQEDLTVQDFQSDSLPDCHDCHCGMTRGSPRQSGSLRCQSRVRAGSGWNADGDNENECANDRDDDVLLHDRRFVSHPESQLQPYCDDGAE